MKSNKATSSRKQSIPVSDSKSQGQRKLLKKTKAQLIDELEQMRQRVEELESLENSHKQTDKALTKSAIHLQAILDSATEVGLITFDLRGKDSRILEFSTGAENIFDYPREEVIGKPVAMLHLPEEAARLPAMFEAMRKHQEGFTGEWSLVRKSGEKFLALFTTHPVFDTDGNTVAALSIAIDISEHKRAEESLREVEEKWRSLAENAPVMITHIDPDGIITSLNSVPPGIDMTIEDIIGKDSSEFIAKPYQAKMREVYDRVLETSVTESYEMQGAFTDKWYYSTVGAIKENDRITGLTVINNDITEQKHAEEALKAIEQQLGSVVHAAPLILWSLDTTGIINLSEGSGLEALGLRPGEIVGQSVYDIYREYPDALNAIKQAMDGELSQIDVEVADRVWNNHYQPIQNHEGSITGIIGVSVDITERKQAEEEVQKLATVVRHSKELVNIATMDGTMVFLNAAGSEMLGIDPDKIAEKNIMHVIPDHLKEMVQTELLPTLLAGGAWEGDLQYRNLKTGELTDVRSMTFTVKNTFTGKPLYLANVSLDITERKRAEELTRIQRNLAQALSITLNLEEAAALCVETAINSSDMDSGGVYLVNPESGALDLICSEGLSPEFVSDTSHYNHETLYAQMIMIGEPIYKGYYELGTLPDPQITTEGLRAIAVIPIFYEDQVIGSLNMGSHTINEIPISTCHSLESIGAQIGSVIARLQTQDALQESEDKYRNVVERANDVIIIIQDGVLKYTNPLATKMMGYTPEEAIGQPLTKFVHPDEVETAAERYYRRIAGEDVPTIYETALIHKDGHRIEVELSGGLISYQGTPADMVIIRDITERKQIEKVLRESEERYRFLTENMADIVWILDQDFNTTYVSPSIEKVLGFTPEERKQQVLVEMITPESAQRVTAMYMEELQRDKDSDTDPERTITMEVEYYHADGHTVWLENSVKGLRDQNGIVIGMHGSSRDITERKRAEVALQETEERWNSLTNNTNDLIQILDIEGNILYMNRVYSPDELSDVVGKSIFEFIDETYQQTAREIIGRLLEEKTPQDYEAKILLSEHDSCDFYIKYVPILVNSEVHRIISYGTDITEKKKAEMSLRESEEKYRLLVESAGVPIMYYDVNGYLLHMNSIAAAQTGVKLENIMGKSILEIIPDNPKKHLKRIQSIAKSGKGRKFEDKISFSQGDRWYISNMQPVKDTEGNVIAIQIISTDVTGIKLAENEIRESEEKFRTIFTIANDAIIYLDKQGTMIDVNDKLEDIFGFSREEVIGKRFTEFAFVNPIRMPQMIKLFDDALTVEGPQLTEFELRHKDGHLVSVEASSTTIVDETGMQGALTILRDITERKKAEEERARIQALEELDQLRTALLASVSHELRTPLTSIKGLASTLVQPDVQWDEETQADFLKSIVQESDRLNHIVSDLLEMSRLEAGIMRIDKTETQISSVIKQINDELNNLTVKHPCNIHIPPNMPSINVDEIRIGEVITNLVSNAASYSEEGTQIEIDASQSNGEIVISIKDEGIGIPPEHQDKVFDRFYRLESGASRRRGGSGLGLAICKGIVEEHEGRIWVESNLGGGSKFSFSLPIVKQVESDHNNSVPMSYESSDQVS